MLEAFAAIVTIVVPVVGSVTWVYRQTEHVRRALRDSDPDIHLSVRSTGGPDMLLAEIKNRGRSTARALVFRATGIEDVWGRDSLAANEVVTAQMELPRDAPLRRREFSNPQASVEFQNKFGHAYTATVALTQEQRPGDGLYNIGSRPKVKVTRPELSRWALWKLRNEV